MSEDETMPDAVEGPGQGYDFSAGNNPLCVGAVWPRQVDSSRSSEGLNVDERAIFIDDAIWKVGVVFDSGSLEN